MPTALHDEHFGEVIIRRNNRSRTMSATVTPTGQLRISVPTLTPLFMIRRMLRLSRKELQALLTSRQGMVYVDGMVIGKTHSLHVVSGSSFHVRTAARQIIVRLPHGLSLTDPQVVARIRPAVIRVLRLQAKQYLPARLAALASLHGYSYDRVRLSHAGTRWGSCSSRGTISLNIALMQLPNELIDYVLVHELVHTRQMNHSTAFWSLVGAIEPDYRRHRKALKTYSPHI